MYMWVASSLGGKRKEERDLFHILRLCSGGADPAPKIGPVARTRAVPSDLLSAIYRGTARHFHRVPVGMGRFENGKIMC